MNNKTIIYYTANREDPEFEEKIRGNILKQKGDLPIISVSQKPIDFGKNICVGDVGNSYINAWRQILIGAKEAKTEYVVMAEADFLYPQEYFEFDPEEADVYKYSNVWIIFTWKFNYFFRKDYSEGAQICKREYLIKALEEHLEGQPEWYDGRFVIKDKKGRHKKSPFIRPNESFGGDIPCVSFKTGKGVRWMTDFMKGRNNMARRLPYWGHFENLKKDFMSL